MESNSFTHLTPLMRKAKVNIIKDVYSRALESGVHSIQDYLFAVEFKAGNVFDPDRTARLVLCLEILFQNDHIGSLSQYRKLVHFLKSEIGTLPDLIIIEMLKACYRFQRTRSHIKTAFVYAKFFDSAFSSSPNIWIRFWSFVISIQLNNSNECYQRIENEHFIFKSSLITLAKQDSLFGALIENEIENWISDRSVTVKIRIFEYLASRHENNNALLKHILLNSNDEVKNNCALYISKLIHQQFIPEILTLLLNPIFAQQLKLSTLINLLRSMTALLSFRYNPEQAKKIRSILSKIVADSQPHAIQEILSNLRRLIQLQMDRKQYAYYRFFKLSISRKKKITTREIHKGALRALSVLAFQGFPIYVNRTARGYQILHGEKKKTSLWKVLHESRNPDSSKRQGYAHTQSRQLRGDLKFSSYFLAERVSTKVPDEPVDIGSGTWQPEIPLLSEAVELLRPGQRKKKIIIRCGSYRTLVQRENLGFSRLLKWIQLSWNFARVAALRNENLKDFQRQLSHFGIRIQIKRIKWNT